ncbi:hypothetical protein ABE562_04870 [Brucella intermedia]|uniref:Uncharacterized protein n=1 Tax=Brucella intermedia GD04153 TaxID=2975438 RepID=A0AA42H077_9HYPH|nr:hypothetical protein [Brucella intermedia]MDH0123298.1 hypothetical protein [Brucella intermedia GD04153]
MATNPKQIQGQLRTRAFSRVPASVDVERKSFGIIISTETPVRTSIRNPDQPKLDADDAYIEVDEILLASGLDFSRTVGMPLVDCHDTFSGVNTILGKVDDVRSVGTEVHGTAVLNSRNADLITDINDGHYNQISAGYGVNSYEIEHRDGDVPVAYAISWTLYEASLVAVGADPNASVRSAARTIPDPTVSFRNKPKPKANSTRTKRKLEKRTMDESTLKELIVAAEDAVAALEEAVVAVEDAVAELGDEAPEELVERARKLRNEYEEQEQRKRKKRSDDEDELKDERKKRNDDEDEKKEEDEIRSIRSVAKSYGLGQLVTDLAKMGTRSSKIREAVGNAIAARSATADFSAKPSDIEPRKRSAAPVLDTSAIYARRNGLTK